MTFDAHVHMGYFPRKDYDEPFYYSPRRVVGVLNHCGVDGFIVSSTCSQIGEISIADIVREAREMKRIAGCKVHIFFWLSGHLYDEDTEMKWMEYKLFDGIKLHEGETPWMQKRYADLRIILSVAEKHGMPVMFHSGTIDGCRPRDLAVVANEYPGVHFNFAHCRPMAEMAKVVAECPNVWTDTAFMVADEFPRLRDYDWHGRLMFGTDLPVWGAHEQCGLSKRYREYVKVFSAAGMVEQAETAFCSFLGVTPRTLERGRAFVDKRGG